MLETIKKNVAKKNKKKSRIWETLNIPTDADNRTNKKNLILKNPAYGRH